jgi:hypothetical protein
MDVKVIAKWTRHEILNALIEDGFEIDPADAADVSKTIQQAARASALLWTSQHIISTLHNAPLTIRK